MNKVNTIEIQLLRNNHIESKHKILITTDRDKNGFEFFPRSAIKPFQIIPLLHFAKNNDLIFDNREIAIFGSSHSGQEEHVEILKKISAKYDIKWEEIYCSPQRPMHIKTADEYILNKTPFTTVSYTHLRAHET